jgi:hypothetical protein
MPKRLENNIRSGFARAAAGSGSTEDLLAAVRILVRDFKREGRPPEKVIVTLKQLCRLSLIALVADTDASTDDTDSKKLFDMVLQAAIGEYYADPNDRTAVARVLRGG